MMNMGEKITEEECEFLVDVSKNYSLNLKMVMVLFRKPMSMVMAVSILKSLLA